MKTLPILYFLFLLLPGNAQKKLDLNSSTTGEKLNDIPTKVFDAKEELIALYLGGNSFSKLPDQMSTLSHLMELDLVNCFDSLVPADVFRPLLPLKELRVLWVSGKFLATTNLSELKQLEFLYWHGLDHYPASFCEMTNLKELHLISPEKKFTSVPGDFAKLINLERLKLRSFSFEYLPDDFGKLKNLQVLDMKLDPIRSLPESFSDLENLKRLDLEYTNIRALPDGFGKLGKLESLDLGHSAIHTLPASFTQLAKLKSLDLSYSSITELPENIGDLKQLESLFISTTPYLKSLPASFANLTSLKMLNLLYSGLDEFPEALFGLPSLKILYVSDADLTRWRITKEDINRRLPACQVSVQKY